MVTLHGNIKVKFHLLSSAKSFALHGHGPLKAWFDAYRARAHYFKATSALARRMAEALWWVMVRQEPYKFWKGEQAAPEPEAVRLGTQLVDPRTGEVLGDLPLDAPADP